MTASAQGFAVVAVFQMDKAAFVGAALLPVPKTHFQRAISVALVPSEPQTQWPSSLTGGQPLWTTPPPAGG